MNSPPFDYVDNKRRLPHQQDVITNNFVKEDMACETPLNIRILYIKAPTTRRIKYGSRDTNNYITNQTCVAS